jgi:hypothetical protein
MGKLRTALEGHDLSLTWGDFQGAVPKSLPPGEGAYTEARFNLNFGYDYDTASKTTGYRITDVLVQVTLDRAVMWAVKSAQTAELLKHEQGHYDIVALVARDLYRELTGWNSAKPPKRFRKDTDLTSAANRLRRNAESLVRRLGGAGQQVGVYDNETNHGLDTKAQEKWDKGLAAARSSGSRLATALTGQGVGGP